eukprot:3098300-Amphidinium_carterae.1
MVKINVLGPASHPVHIFRSCCTAYTSLSAATLELYCQQNGKALHEIRQVPALWPGAWRDYSLIGREDDGVIADEDRHCGHGGAAMHVSAQLPGTRALPQAMFKLSSQIVVCIAATRLPAESMSH